MTKTEKLRARILEYPTRSDIRHDELRQFLLNLGLIEIGLGKTSGSRIKFYDPNRPSIQIRLHKSHGNTPVDRNALRDVIAKIKKLGLLK